jgi:hypothetical protein
MTIGVGETAQTDLEPGYNEEILPVMGDHQLSFSVTSQHCTIQCAGFKVMSCGQVQCHAVLASSNPNNAVININVEQKITR